MKKVIFLAALFLSACAPIEPHIKHLGPLTESSPPPAQCKIAGVVPNSPAQKAGIQAGETLVSVNGAKPADALGMSDLIDHSTESAQFEVSDSHGKIRTVKVSLNKEKPRLGASCNLTGWTKSSVSSAGNESLTVFNGPYALTVSGIFDKGLAFMRVRISNHSDKPLPVSMALFSVTDGSHAPLAVLSPEEVMYFMHGEDAVPFIVRPSSGAPIAPVAVSTNSVVRQTSPPHQPRKEWSRSDESYVRANAEYVNKESFWPATVEPGKVADGLIYFIEPKALPMTITADVEGSSLTVSFGLPKPSTQRMTADEIVHFFETQKRGTGVRLTLKNGTVFVGKYSSYDGINEIAWFDTPSGVLLTTSSFGLKYIAYVEVLTPDQDKKQPIAEPLN